MGQVETSARHMIPLADELFGRQEFVDVAYFEPFYLKDFIATTPKKKSDLIPIFAGIIGF